MSQVSLVGMGKGPGRDEDKGATSDRDSISRAKEPTLPSRPSTWRRGQGVGSHPARAVRAAWAAQHSSLSPPRHGRIDIYNNPALIKLDDVSEAIGQARRKGHQFELKRNTRRRAPMGTICPGDRQDAGSGAGLPQR